MKGVYLAEGGSISIERESLNVPLSSVLDEGDVNAVGRRFSFDFDTGALITGDKVAIRNIDGDNLVLVVGHNYPDGEWFINIDEAGGIRLYDTYKKALNGGYTNAFPLETSSAVQNIEVQTKGDGYKFISKIRDYSFTTSRDNIDLTGIGEEFRKKYASGLISGQGNINCFWDFTHGLCDDNCVGDAELAQYFAELVIRLQQGSSFAARLYLLDAPQTESSVWWDVPICIVTNVAMAFEPGLAVRTSIDFVTSSAIHMKMGQPPAYLLLQQGGFLLQQNDSRLELEED
jgi:hypothetical protein